MPVGRPRGGRGSAVQHPYVVLAVALALLAVVIMASQAPRIDTASLRTPTGPAGGSDRGSAWRYRHLCLGAVAIFVYVGGEVAIG